MTQNNLKQQWDMNCKKNYDLDYNDFVERDNSSITAVLDSVDKIQIHNILWCTNKEGILGIMRERKSGIMNNGKK